MDDETVRELYVVGGPNGAGKTTFALEFVRERPMLYLSADAIASELDPADPTSQRIAAGREFLRRCTAAIDNNKAILIESTLSGVTLQRYLKRASNSGYRINIVFCSVDSVDCCLERVRERVRKGGHDVSAEDVRRRFERSMQNFWNLYRRIADEWMVVYNMHSRFETVVVGSESSRHVHDEALFARFKTLLNLDERS